VTDPRPIKDASNQSFYDVDSQTYDEQRWHTKGGAFTDRAQQSILQSLCADWNEKRVLEVGAGTARFSIPLLRKHNRMTLVDISSGMLATAKANIEAAELADRVDAYLEESVYELPFDDGSFDHAISLNVFNHLERPGDALKQLARVIRPGSTLLFNYANSQSYYWPAARRINHSKLAIGQNVYSTWERPRDVRAWIRDSGLELVQQLGNVHVPRAIEKYPVYAVVQALDAVSRSGPLRRLAPFQFCLCRKRDE
jgi:ubiquinone/menaquinone biosynthesis C-methylase UbiE